MIATARRAWVLRMAARVWWLPVVAIGLAIDRGSRARWLLTPGVVVLAASASTIGKLVIRRPRPNASMRVVPFGQLGPAGFPSTHTACAFAIAGWQRGSRQGRWLHLVAISIGYLRVRRRAHHLGDVVAGAILGYIVARRIDALWSRLRTSRASHREGHAGKHRLTRAMEPRSAVDHQSLPGRGRLAAPAGRQPSRPSARRRRSGLQHERTGTTVSALEVA